jgi:uncharacterized protein YdeI (YjbR/CyaY-like superfamily)
LAAKEIPILLVTSVSVWEEWLCEHHAKLDGVWLKIAKKVSGIPSVTHDEVLDVALCYGWIDGQRKGYDDKYFLQKFSPRRRKSLWSKRNVNKVADLSAVGRMQPSGLAEVEAAKQDGRWQAAYDSSKDIVFPDDFLNALEKNKKAQAFFNTLSKSSMYAIAWRLATAKKPEIRKRRFEAMLEMLERGKFRY